LRQQLKDYKKTEMWFGGSRKQKNREKMEISLPECLRDAKKKRNRQG